MVRLDNFSDSTKSARLNLRLFPQRKRLIEQAAAIEHTTPSEFIMRTVIERAEKVIAEQCHFFLEAEKWEEFCNALDAPTREIIPLKKLASEKTILEK